MATDLDAHLTQRALASLSAELTRRERMLAAAGAKDIEEYTEQAGRERALSGLVNDAGATWGALLQEFPAAA